MLFTVRKFFFEHEKTNNPVLTCKVRKKQVRKKKSDLSYQYMDPLQLALIAPLDRQRHSDVAALTIGRVNGEKRGQR